MQISRRGWLKGTGLAGFSLAAGGCEVLQGQREKTGGASTGKGEWYKGNLHMHTFWSDGSAFPEEAVDLYKREGYRFLSLTDHNQFPVESRWLPVEAKSAGWPFHQVAQSDFERYLKVYGKEVDTKTVNGKRNVRLKPFSEMAKRSDDPGNFLLIPGTENTESVRKGETGYQLHTNCVGLCDIIPSMKDPSKRISKYPDVRPSELIRHNMRQTAELAGGKPYIFTLNHPFWPYCDVLPEDLLECPELRFYEVNNVGSNFDHPATAMEYDHGRFWDVINAFRAKRGEPLIYGEANDDTHSYFGNSRSEMAWGKWWNMVRAPRLSQNAILNAMLSGDFYLSSGVTLDEVSFDPKQKTLFVAVRPERYVHYSIQFITTKRGFDEGVRWVDVPRNDKKRPARRLPVHTKEIGKAVKVVSGVSASYSMAEDDLYVRALITSDRDFAFRGVWRSFGFDKQMAWTQPFR